MSQKLIIYDCKTFFNMHNWCMVLPPRSSCIQAEMATNLISSQTDTDLTNGLCMELPWLHVPAQR